jgi:hypothetical protein
VYTAGTVTFNRSALALGVKYSSSIASPIVYPVSPLAANDQGPRTTLCLSTGERSGLALLEQIFHIRYHLKSVFGRALGKSEMAREQDRRSFVRVRMLYLSRGATRLLTDQMTQISITASLND